MSVPNVAKVIPPGPEPNRIFNPLFHCGTAPALHPSRSAFENALLGVFSVISVTSVLKAFSRRYSHSIVLGGFELMS